MRMVKSMRLIDADALLYKMCGECIGKAKCPRPCYEETLIKTMPTIEAEPKHGRWIEDEYGIPHCSECQAINNTVYRNYCPECGADMRERGEV